MQNTQLNIFCRGVQRLYALQGAIHKGIARRLLPYFAITETSAESYYFIVLDHFPMVVYNSCPHDPVCLFFRFRIVIKFFFYIIFRFRPVVENHPEFEQSTFLRA